MLLVFLMQDFLTLVSPLLAIPMLDSQLLLLQLKPRLRNKSLKKITKFPSLFKKIKKDQSLSSTDCQ